MQNEKKKFESKSNRVKGLAFHPTRPWILTSLHNGQIQLYDYIRQTIIDKFEEHDGPVRGIDFHKVQPLFVSGGDDYRVKVWDYKQRRCLFTLLGHLDYIRTVQFHQEYPWVVSASDDQTIKIWNWQSRMCISTLTGHNHYVMCAAFHPKDDLIVSASLDQTVRVWDTTGLRKKHVRGPPSQVDDGTVVTRVNNELFGGNDALVKYVLEGHERGVNWAAFHPTLPLVVSGADDRMVKLWRHNESKAWEVDTMRGHAGNVSCVLFHPKSELIISNSEDRSIRVWDMTKRMCLHTFRRENDRFWILAAHPEQTLLAAGHDSGMFIFKLERERPAFEVVDNKCFFVKDRYIRLLDFASGRDTPLVSLRRAQSSVSGGVGGGPKTLNYNIFNKSENNVLVTSDADGGSYELITFSADTSSASGDASDVKRGLGLAAVFIGRSKFVVLDKSKKLTVRDFQNSAVKTITIPTNATYDGLFFGGQSGNVILKSEDRVVLFDTQAQRVITEVQARNVKFAFWNKDFSMIAFITKKQTNSSNELKICNKQFEQLCIIRESVKLKSGAWDAHKSIFIYTTLNHIKYALANGDKGILRCIDTPIYVTKVVGNTLYCLDREGKSKTIEIDLTEALFKLALERKDYPEVVKLVKNSRLCGQAIITYMQEKGYPEVALHFVTDPKVRFKLALACGNIEVAMQVAPEVGDDAWRQLGVEALRQGNHTVVEMAYQRTKDFERLSFLYLITGNTEKLRKMLKIADMRGDIMSRFHNALYLGAAEERVRVFEATNNISLAFLTATVHGLTDQADRLRGLLEASNTAIPDIPTDASLLQPPTPIIRSENWPLLAVGKTVFSDIVSGDRSAGVSNVAFDESDDENSFEDAKDKEKKGNWADDEDDLFSDDEDADKKKKGKKGGNEGPGSGATGGSGAENGGKGWADDDDLDLSDDEDVDEAGGSKGGSKSSGSEFTMFTAGPSPVLSWCAESSHAADHFAAGSVESAVQLLNRQIATSNISSLKPHAVSLFLGSMAYLPGLSSTPSSRSLMTRESGTKAGSGKTMVSLPTLSLKMPPLLDSLKAAYKAFTNGAFTECRTFFESIVSSIPLISVASKQEGSELKELMDVCREYITALNIKNAVDENADNVVRSLELNAYFSHCGLQPSHLMMALNKAMSAAFKAKNFINAATFARKLLEVPDVSQEKHAETRTKAQKVIQKCEKEARNEYKINYDEMNPFVIDCASLSPIYRGSPVIKCPYCASSYSPAYKGNICRTCNISSVGLETLGLVTQSQSKR